MTEMEQRTLKAIEENADTETMQCVDLSDLVGITGIPAKQLRGVLASLIKKDLIEIEEYDANFEKQTFYWLQGAWEDQS